MCASESRHFPLKRSDKDQLASEAAAAALQPAVNHSQHAAVGRKAGFCMGDNGQPGKPDPFSRLRAKISLTETAEHFFMFEKDVRNK